MRAVTAAFIAATLLLGVSCDSAPEQTDPEAVAARLQLPQQVVGLRVQPEKVGSDLKKIDRPYVDTVAVFSLREEELLRASLQINRFNRVARPDDRDFREQIAGTIGGTTPLILQVSGEPVYATTAADQTVFTWFDGDGMFVLAVQKEFPFPRTLLRRMIDLELSA